MSNIKKSLIVPVAVVTMAGGVIFANSQVSARGLLDNHASLVQKLAEKFNLNEEEVQTVFAEIHDEHRVEMQTKFKEKLSEAVVNDELTEEQRQAIFNKYEEMRTAHEESEASWGDLSPEESRAKMKEQRQMMQAWAEENGVDFKYFGQKQENRESRLMKSHEW